LAIELREAVPGIWDHLEHIGSTSVPGLAAKPVIDLMAATTDLDRMIQIENPALLTLGYIRTETGMTGRLFYRRNPGTPPAQLTAVHLHVVPTATWTDRNERLLRDHLIAHPVDAERYGDLKKRLAGQIADPLAYTRAKTNLIQELVDRARNDRGLPPENVWPD
jgi:GrpB-like predicted nucleotidyltransferase (UPF0157 family)